MKIRHYGLLAPGNVNDKLVRALALLGGSREGRERVARDHHLERLLAQLVRLCPNCGVPLLHRPLPTQPPREGPAVIGRRTPVQTTAWDLAGGRSSIRHRPGPSHPPFLMGRSLADRAAPAPDTSVAGAAVDVWVLRRPVAQPYDGALSP